MSWFDSSDVTTVPIEVVGSESGGVICAVVNQIVGAVLLSLVSEMRRVDVPSLLLPPAPHAAGEVAVVVNGCGRKDGEGDEALGVLRDVMAGLE